MSRATKRMMSPLWIWRRLSASPVFSLIHRIRRLYSCGISIWYGMTRTILVWSRHSWAVRLSCVYGQGVRSEEHTSELQSLMRISYAVFGLKTKTQNIRHKHESQSSKDADRQK